MSRTLANMSRALHSYGQQSSRISSEAARTAAMFKVRAGDARARGIRQRGQTFANMASGLGNMVGGAMLQNRERERQQPMQDLNMQLGKQRLEMGEQRRADMETARAEKEQVKASRQQYVKILSENHGDPVATMTALKDAGMTSELSQFYQNLLSLREQKAKTSVAEAKEVSTNARLVSETIGGLLRVGEGQDRDEQYSIARGRILSLAPELESMLPEAPDAMTYEILADTATMMRTGADQANMDKAEFNKADRWWKKQGSEDDKAQDVFNNAVERLSNVNKKAWQNEVEFQRRRIQKFSPDRLDTFDSLTSAGHSKDTKAALKEWAGKDNDFTGEYGNYRTFAEESGETPIGPLEFARAMAKAKKVESPDEKDSLSPSEALAVIRYVDAQAKDRKESEVENFDTPLEELRQSIATERGFDLGRLEALAVGKETDILDFSSMNDDEFQALIGKKGELTPEQLEAAAQEWDRRFSQ